MGMMMAMMMGGATVQLSNTSAIDSNFGGASAGYELQSDGDIFTSTSLGGGVDEGDWIVPKAAAPGSYEVRATLNSGSLSSGTTGSWMALSTTRSWSVFRGSAGTSSAELLIEIRLGSTVLASCTVTLQATVT